MTKTVIFLDVLTVSSLVMRFLWLNQTLSCWSARFVIITIVLISFSVRQMRDGA